MAALEQNLGTGRRKRSIARVYLRKGNGKITINGRSLEDYLGRKTTRMIVRQPFALLDIENKFDVIVNVKGGGLSGQADAIRHGITRALIQYDEEDSGGAEGGALGYRKALRAAGFVTRDPRKKERKTPGLRKARKAPQYSKR